jgi:hypothetical protein
MSKFADYLRTLGTAEADITILDTPAAQKAYDAMEARVVAEQQKMLDYQDKVNDYYTTTNAKAKQLENQAIVASADAARAKAALMEAQRQGLVDVAKDLGYTPEDPNARREPVVDPNAPKYLTLDTITPYLDNAGDGLAAVMDAMAEHSRLFPDKPFNAREIRRQAVAAKKSFYEFWEQSFGVPAARTAAQKAAQDAHDKAIADAARVDERAKFASEYGNPATRPAVSSTSPFIVKKAADGQVQQPWAKSEDAASNDRVRRATENFIKRGETGATH